MTDPRAEMLEHLPSLRAFARSLTRDAVRADDLVQDTLLKALANIERFEPNTNLKAWLFTIMRNHFYSGRRKAKREVEDGDGALAAALSVSPRHDAKLEFQEFLEAFSQLSSEHREALTLIGALGFSYEDAAQTCGVALGTMKSRTNRARKELAQLMGLMPGELSLSALPGTI